MLISNKYDVFRGGPHGGHYHCYIRDIDSLGEWRPDTTSTSNSKTAGDYLDLNCPVQLLQNLLSRSPHAAIPVDKLCAVSPITVAYLKLYSSLKATRTDDRIIERPRQRIVE